MSGDDRARIVEQSLEWERQTGADSIPTIERVYEQNTRGAYRCVWLKCNYTDHDAAVMWRHVHTAHGRNDLPPEVPA